MRTRTFLHVVVLLLLAAGSVGCRSDKSEDKTFRVAIITWVGYAPIHLAQEKGFFEGIDVELKKIEDTAARRAALVSGQVHGSIDIVDSFTNAAAAGLPAKVVLKLDDSVGGDGVVVKNEISSIQDLKGCTVAYPPGQPSHFFLLALLKEAGMSIDDIESRPMEADQAGAAFISRGVDAAVTWEPWLTKASQLEHGKILTTSREKPGLIVDVFTVREDYLSENSEVVEAFIRGWFRAVEYWKQNPQEANQIMARALGLSLEEFEQMITGVRYSDLEANHAFFTLGDDGSSAFRQLVEKAGEIWQGEGVIEKTVPSASVDGSAIVLGLEK
ncbi:ABC transporter substrate-binding protein [Planctomycetota bacterium]